MERRSGKLSQIMLFRNGYDKSVSSKVNGFEALHGHLACDDADVSCSIENRSDDVGV
jgi:hypothetical protein